MKYECYALQKLVRRYRINDRKRVCDSLQHRVRDSLQQLYYTKGVYDTKHFRHLWFASL